MKFFPGFLYDALSSYNTAFYICGATTTISSLLLFLVPVLTRRDNGRRFERDSINSRLDSFMSISRSINDSSIEKTIPFGVSGTKSGLRTNERLLQKRQLVREQSTIYSEREFNIDNDALQPNSTLGDIDKRVPRGRSVSFASDKDLSEPEEMFLHQPSYHCDVFDGVDFTDSSSSSSGCVLGNSFNTSQNTSFNSSMSNRGSITKVLLLKQFFNGSPTRSPDQSRRGPSLNLVSLARLTPSNNSLHKNVESLHVTKETVV